MFRILVWVVKLLRVELSQLIDQQLLQYLEGLS